MAKAVKKTIRFIQFPFTIFHSPQFYLFAMAKKKPFLIPFVFWWPSTWKIVGHREMRKREREGRSFSGHNLKLPFLRLRNGWRMERSRNRFSFQHVLIISRVSQNDFSTRYNYHFENISLAFTEYLRMKTFSPASAIRKQSQQSTAKREKKRMKLKTMCSAIDFLLLGVEVAFAAFYVCVVKHFFGEMETQKT